MFSNLTASYDPVFWPVHANIDRIWWDWQQLHPNAEPVDLDAILTPWSYTIRDTLDMQRFGYEYVKCTHIMPVGLTAPVGRFVSKPMAIPETVRRAFRSRRSAPASRSAADRGPASSASSSTCRTPMPQRRSIIRTMPATSPSSATAPATADPATAIRRRPAHGNTTFAHAATTRRAITASTSRTARIA